MQGEIRGFTLVELAVTLAVAAILLAHARPRLRPHRGATRDARKRMAVLPRGAQGGFSLVD